MWQSSARECLPIREKACSVDTSGEYQSRFSPIITHRQAIDVYTEQHLEFRRGDHRRRRNRLWPQSMNMNPVLSLFCLAALLLASCGDRQPVKERYDDRRLFPILQNGKWGYIDHVGKVVVNPRFDFADRFSEGMAAIQSGDKWGYIDASGNVVIAATFDHGDAFADGLALVIVRETGHSPQV